MSDRPDVWRRLFQIKRIENVRDKEFSERFAGRFLDNLIELRESITVVAVVFAGIAFGGMRKQMLDADDGLRFPVRCRTWKQDRRV